jgi:mannose/fructose/N-acetylgalactosamine-specific phosphotransferase system component IIC
MSVILAGFIYALLSLDQIAVGPFLLSRPVVVGSLVGAALGNGPLGFSVGLAVELLFISVPPVGLRSSDVSLVGGLAALWSIQAYSARDGAPLLALLLAAPCGWAVTEADRWVRRHNDRFGDWILGHLREGRERFLWEAFSLWAGLWFMKAWIVFLTFGFIGQALVDAGLRFLPLRVLAGLDAGTRLLPAACFAAAAGYFWNRLRPPRETKA